MDELVDISRIGYIPGSGIFFQRIHSLIPSFHPVSVPVPVAITFRFVLFNLFPDYMMSALTRSAEGCTARY